MLPHGGGHELVRGPRVRLRVGGRSRAKGDPRAPHRGGCVPGRGAAALGFGDRDRHGAACEIQPVGLEQPADRELHPRRLRTDRRDQLRIGHRALEGRGDVGGGAPAQQAVDRHVQQQLALTRAAAFEVREPLGLAERIPHQRGAHEDGHEADRLQPELELPIAAGDAGDRPLDHRQRLLRILAPRTARPHQRERGVRALHIVHRDLGRREHVVERLGTAEAVLGPCEVQQQRRALAGRRRLGEGARQRRGGLGQRSRRERAPARLGQRLRDRLVSTWFGVQQVHGDRLRRGARLGEDPGGVGVQPCALSRRHSAQHGIAHERVLERERPDVTQDPGAHEPLAQRRGLLRIEAGQPRGRDQRRPLEHRDTAGEPGRRVPQARERRADRSRDRVRPEPGHRGGIDVAGAIDSAFAQSLGQPADQQRIASGGAVARLDERGGDRGAVALGEHCGRRIERQRRELDRCRERRRAKRTLARGGGRPLSRQHQCRDGVEPVRKELQEPDRGAVGPVQVVDDEQLRPLRRQRGDEPIQAVEHAERRVGVAWRHGRVRQHDRTGQRGGTGKRPAARIG